MVPLEAPPLTRRRRGPFRVRGLRWRRFWMRVGVHRVRLLRLRARLQPLNLSRGRCDVRSSPVVKRFQRGQKSRPGNLVGCPSALLEDGVVSEAPIVFDASYFGKDENHTLSDDRHLVSYNQRRSPEGTVGAPGGRGGVAEVFRVDLDGLPGRGPRAGLRHDDRRRGDAVTRLPWTLATPLRRRGNSQPSLRRGVRRCPGGRPGPQRHRGPLPPRHIRHRRDWRQTACPELQTGSKSSAAVGPESRLRPA